MKTDYVSTAKTRSGKNGKARGRERRDGRGLCRVNMIIRKETAWHLEHIAASCGGKRDIGRAVDKLVRAHRLGLRGKEDSYGGEGSL